MLVAMTTKRLPLIIWQSLLRNKKQLAFSDINLTPQACLTREMRNGGNFLSKEKVKVEEELDASGRKKCGQRI